MIPINIEQNTIEIYIKKKSEVPYDNLMSFV